MSKSQDERKETFRKSLKAMVFAQSFVEVMDEFAGSSAFKQEIKFRGKAFVKTVDNFLNTVYKDGGANSEMIDLIEACQNAIDDVIDKDLEITEECTCIPAKKNSAYMSTGRITSGCKIHGK